MSADNSDLRGLAAREAAPSMAPQECPWCHGPVGAPPPHLLMWGGHELWCPSQGDQRTRAIVAVVEDLRRRLALVEAYLEAAHDTQSARTAADSREGAARSAEIAGLMRRLAALEEVIAKLAERQDGQWVRIAENQDDASAHRAAMYQRIAKLEVKQ